MSPGAATLLECPRTFSRLLCNLVFTRPMGGGPRTFPGGVTKWQWRRMHEKKARAKEMRRIEQEKELYQARILSYIRAKLSGKSDPPISPNPSTGGGPRSTTDHIKALANRFMKEGAEDLWNEEDGPLTSSPPRGPNGWKPVWEGRENVNLINSNSVNTRNYSVQSRRRFRRNEGSDEDSDYGPVKEPAKPFAKNLGGNCGRGVRKVGSSASLGKYDMKIAKRVLLRLLEEESVFPGQVELIMRELSKKKSVRNERMKYRGFWNGKYLCANRFDECGISSMTVEAHATAGYVQMTRVQEAAALSVYLEGMLAASLAMPVAILRYVLY
ncbi:hypothetical protein I3842_12G094600 [Carya illinoinensis]|uniref:Uncharacterized protein n=1 Tax=Carya illinoinensis TaxID=32201 RepID=A0A922DIN5_CARIL|nr:hypothetical protein I3842_12G094600 [Carya illinoinensis]